MGFSVSQHGQVGAISPPPFLSVSLGEHANCGGAIPPPPHKGVSQRYLRDTLCKQGKARAIPPVRYLERALRDMQGGKSRTGLLSGSFCLVAVVHGQVRAVPIVGSDGSPGERVSWYSSRVLKD